MTSEDPSHETAWNATADGADADALVRRLIDAFTETQYWPPERILEAQLQRLEQLLQHFLHTSPGYRTYVGRDHWNACSSLTLDLFRSLPPLTRVDIQRCAASLRSNAIPAMDGRALATSTSGSTGHPLIVWKTERNRAYHRALNLRNHLWHGRDLSGKFATLRRFNPGTAMPPHGRRMKRWTALLPTGPSVILNCAHCPIDMQARWLMDMKPAYALSYPSNLDALGRYFEAHELKAPWLKGLVTIGELLSLGRRRAIEDTFGVHVRDIYSAAEVSTMALECPDVPGTYHVQAENVLLEVVDAAGRPCEVGELGRVVVTDLQNFATPLIRYEIGDLAVPGHACPCGRGLATLQRVLGRSRGLLRVPGGGLHYPDLASLHILRIPAIVQYQMRQTDIDRIELVLVLRRPLTAEEETILRRSVVDRFGGGHHLTIDEVAEIPRHPNGKFEDFVSLVSD